MDKLNEWINWLNREGPDLGTSSKTQGQECGGKQVDVQEQNKWKWRN